jgi:hypothetical protein
LSSSPEFAGVDFFRHGGLPVPQVTIQEAERVAASFFPGRTVRAQPLGSQQDSNFLLTEPTGAVAGVLKIANPAFSAAEIEAQDTAAELVAAAGLRAGTVRHGPVTVRRGRWPGSPPLPSRPGSTCGWLPRWRCRPS